MAKNLYSPGNKVPNDKYRDNFDRIFGKKKLNCDQDCGDNCSCKNTKPKK